MGIHRAPMSTSIRAVTTDPAPRPSRVRVPVRLLGTGACVPDVLVSNEEIAARCGVSASWIEERIGLRSRRRAPAGLATSDLATEAARSALARAGVEPSTVDLVACATCTPDHAFPSTAALVADRIGARGAGAFDLQAGCAGFVHAFVLAAQSVALGTARRVLVIGADVVSRLADPTDPSVAPIFGDGAGAALLGPGDTDHGLESTCLGADGGSADLLVLPGGGSRDPAAATLLRMDGPALYRQAVRRQSAAALGALDAAGATPADVDVVVPHQSSRRLIEATARETRIPLDRFVVNIEGLGNTASASLALALHDAAESGRIRPGSRTLLLGFGAGLSWGAALLRA